MTDISEAITLIASGMYKEIKKSFYVSSEPDTRFSLRVLVLQ